MSLSTIIKQNRVFIAGIALPLILIALMTFAKSIPMNDPPQNGAVFWVKDYSERGSIEISVSPEHKAILVYKKDKDFKATNVYEPRPVTATIYIYDPKSPKLDEIRLKVTPEDETQDIKTLDVPKLNNLKLSNTPVSPDGYTFEPYSYGRYSLITDIFGGYRSYGPFLKKGTTRISLSSHNNYVPSNLELVGWITGVDAP